MTARRRRRPLQQASASSARSVSSSGSSAWASGSPKRQLNSSSRGPSAVSISPAYSTPMYGVPTAARWSSTGWMNVRGQLGRRRTGSGAGAYAPMPPVFGPVSPSPMRLWSWATGRATSHGAVAERHQAALGPASRSSSTIGPCADQFAGSRRRSRPRSSGTTTPLPAARPSSFTTTGRPSVGHQAMASSASIDGGGTPATAGPASRRARGCRPSTLSSRASPARGAEARHARRRRTGRRRRRPAPPRARR